jgi:hypothetical protein
VLFYSSRPREYRHIAVGRFQRADVHAETLRDGGTYLFGVELFALDVAALEHVFSKGIQDGFLPEIESKALYATD